MLNELKNIGLSDKEAKVYLAALELGKSSIQEIAKKAGINRTTTYVMITELEKRGLIKPLKIGKRNQFIAEGPDTILEILRREKQKIEDKEREIKEILPELKSIYNVAPGRPKIRFYEGIEVNKKINEDILESGAKEILEIYNADFIRDIISEEEANNFYKKRVAQKIKYRALYTRKEGPFKNPLEMAEERFIKQEQFPVSGDIFVYEDRVGMAGKEIGVIIESAEISRTLKTLFELAWQGQKYLGSESSESLDGAIEGE